MSFGVCGFLLEFYFTIKTSLKNQLTARAIHERVTQLHPWPDHTP